MKIILISLFFFLSINSLVNAQTKVLFLGNSFTYTYDIPSLFEGLANSAGISVFVDERTTAGIAVYDQPNQGLYGHINDNLSQSKIASKQWDYVVVQDNIGGWVYNYIAGGPANANTTLANQIKLNNSCTKIIYLAAWGPKGGVPSLGYPNESTQSCIERVHTNFINYNNNASTSDEIVSPVGKSWIQSFNQMSNIDLYHSDNVHPSLAGSYLAASTIFATIFKVNPSSLSYTGSLNATVASNLRGIAWNQVTNSTLMDETNLTNHTPEITVNGNILTVTGFSSPYQWFLDGSPINGATSSSYVATSNGAYTVSGSGSDGCNNNRSFNVELLSVGIEDHLSSDFKLEVLVSKQLLISGEENGVVYIHNLKGELLKKELKTNNELLVDFSNGVKGLYIVSLINDNQRIIKKVTLF